MSSESINTLKEVINEWRDQPEKVADFIRWNNRFHDYSPFNRMMIKAQRPDATRCASYSGWANLGRKPKGKGTGIAIFRPHFRKVTEEDENGEEQERRLSGYGTAYTFDIENTVPIDPEDDNYADLIGEVAVPPGSPEELDQFITHIANIMDVTFKNMDLHSDSTIFAASGTNGEKIIAVNTRGTELEQLFGKIIGAITVMVEAESLNKYGFDSYCKNPDIAGNVDLNGTQSSVPARTLITAWAIMDRFGIDATPLVHLALTDHSLDDEDTFNSALLDGVAALKVFDQIESGVPQEWAMAFYASRSGATE